MSTTQIQRILDKAGAIVIPGIYDTLSAKIAEQVGFPMAFVSGYSVAATMIGEPDLGLLTQTEMIKRARHICTSVSIPVIIDADTGYGNPLNVYRTIKELIAAGAAGCFLILYPLSGLFSAAEAIRVTYQKLNNDGTTLGEQDRLMHFEQFNELIGVEEKYTLAERFGA